jgi:hypothetical protein
VPCVYLSDDADATPTMALKREVESLQRRVQEYVNFLESIRTAPEDEVLHVVRQLRSTEDAYAILSSYQGRAGGISRISEHTTARATIPLMESDIEFELVTLHPKVYPVAIPPNPSSVTSASLTRGLTLQGTATSLSSTSLSTSLHHKYCDLRLERLAVRYWTRIPIDDQLAAQAISHFLEVDHPILGFFDADLFLRDLVDQRLDFCSSFLFGSVMSLACVCLQRMSLFKSSFN